MLVTLGTSCLLGSMGDGLTFEHTRGECYHGSMPSLGHRELGALLLYADVPTGVSLITYDITVDNV